MNSEEKRLKEAFDYVRHVFFPQWDKMGEWNVEFVPSRKIIPDPIFEIHLYRPCSKVIKSISSPNYKTISLEFMPDDEDDTYAMLIHLICHAIYGKKHERRWCERVYDAAFVALRAEHNNNLFNLLWEEIELYYRQTNPNDVYNLMKAAVFRRPKASYKSIISEVAYKVKMLPEELKKQFKYTKYVYLIDQKSYQEFEIWKKEYASELEEFNKRQV